MFNHSRLTKRCVYMMLKFVKSNIKPQTTKIF